MFAEILQDYWPLLDKREVSQVVVVTRNGVVANAREVFDGVRTSHATLEELSLLILQPHRLIQNMREVYENDLAHYYVETQAYDLNIRWAARNFDLVYSDFISFALQSGLRTFEDARKEWRIFTADTPESNQPERYTSGIFDEIMTARMTSNSVPLEPIVDSWVNNDAIPHSLALIGSYGMGKSSFARRLAYQYAVRYQQGKASRLPLLIELRNFSSHQDIEGLLLHELHERHGLHSWSLETFRRLNSAWQTTNNS